MRVLQCRPPGLGLMGVKSTALDKLPVRGGSHRAHLLAEGNHDKAGAVKAHTQERDQDKHALKAKAIHHWSDRITESEPCQRKSVSTFLLLMRFCPKTKTD